MLDPSLRAVCATHGDSHQHGTVDNVIRQTKSRYVTAAVSIRGDWWQMHAEVSDDVGLAVAHVWGDGSLYPRPRMFRRIVH